VLPDRARHWYDSRRCLCGLTPSGNAPYINLNAVQALAKMAEHDPPLPPEGGVVTKAYRHFMVQCVQRHPGDRADAAALLMHPFVAFSVASVPELAKTVSLASLRVG
jgi:hypothetical protein